MHRVLLNEMRLDLTLRPRSAFLVKEGDKASAMLHPELADLQPMRAGGSVFIPGSSLKGAIRSASERLLRSVGPHSERWACDPFDMRNGCHTAGRRDGHSKIASTEVHARQCLACRTYGSQQIRGRVAISDALPTPETRLAANQVESRTGVGIDRRSGAAKGGALFEMEVVTSGRFEVSIVASNVQLWQAALLAAVLEDMEAGLVRLGGSGTRGLGAMRVHVDRLGWWQARGESPAGVATLGGDPAYGWLPDGALDSMELPAPIARRGGKQWSWEGEETSEILRTVQELGWSHLTSWQPEST